MRKTRFPLWVKSLRVPVLDTRFWVGQCVAWTADRKLYELDHLRTLISHGDLKARPHGDPRAVRKFRPFILVLGGRSVMVQIERAFSPSASSEEV